jgi:hypothetical protein
MAIRVFMVGKSDKVMEQMAADMGPEFEVTHTEKVSRAREEFDPEKYDVVILGRALKGPDREALLGTVSDPRAGLPVITSLAPCGQLSAAHAKAAISEARPEAKILKVSGVDAHHVRFHLTRPADVTVTLYTLSMMQYLLKVKPIFSGPLPAGSHEIEIPRTIGDRFERKHLYVSADNRDARLIKMRGL